MLVSAYVWKHEKTLKITLFGSTWKLQRYSKKVFYGDSLNTLNHRMLAFLHCKLLGAFSTFNFLELYFSAPFKDQGK